jgi:hypothetical protein
MWEFSVPPHTGDEHFDLGIWHPSALPADQQNQEGYLVLGRRVEEEDCTCEVEESHPSEAEEAIQAFHDEVIALVDALPDEEVSSRSWSIVFRCNPLFHLISLWPTVAIELAPAITESATRHGLVCYDPQNDVVTLPQT